MQNMLCYTGQHETVLWSTIKNTVGLPCLRGRTNYKPVRFLKSSANKCYDLLKWGYFERTYKEDTKSQREEQELLLPENKIHNNSGDK